ncbi:MAG: hypothetical protein ABIY70_09090 [Capsulimonas sp.]|uniref:beta strand repeat-containing protein n=1 Tax=Capsulimonas sp. TaxID=2494211 RepID=UPI00326769C6
MKPSLRTFTLALAALALSVQIAAAAVVSYPFRVTDDSGVLVSGATVAIGATTLTSGSATTVPTNAGEKILGTNAAPASTVSITLLDYGTGDYSLLVDPSVTGELYIPLTVSKAATTITNGNALVGAIISQDSALVASSNTRLTTALPNAAPAASGGLLTVGTGAGQLNPNGSGGLSGLTTANFGTAQTGSSTTLTLAVGASATTDLYKGDYIAITGGTGAGQARTITGYVGGTLVATVSRPWTVTPDSSSVYAVIMNPHPALDANLAVTAGTVGDKTGYTASTVTDKTGYSVSTITDKTGYSLTVTPPTVAAIRAEMDANSTQFVAINAQTTAAQQQANVIAALVAQGYTVTRAAKLDNADVATSTRNSVTPPTVTQIRQEMDTNSTKLGNLDATMSSRLASSAYTAPPTTSQIASTILVTPAQKIVTDINGFVTTSNPVSGGSAVTEASIWAYGSRTLTAQSDSSGISTLLSRIPGTVQPQTGDAYARIGAPAGASIAVDIAAGTSASTSNGTQIAQIKAKTDQLTFTGSNVNAAAQNLPSDYQQRGVAVTLPMTAPSGYGGGSSLTVDQIAAAVWGYQLSGMYTGSILFDTWLTGSGNSAASYSGSNQTTTFTYGSGNTVGHTSTLTTNSSGKPTGRSYTAGTLPH